MVVGRVSAGLSGADALAGSARLLLSPARPHLRSCGGAPAGRRQAPLVTRPAFAGRDSASAGKSQVRAAVGDLLRFSGGLKGNRGGGEVALVVGSRIDAQMIGHRESFQLGGLLIPINFGLIAGAIGDDAVIVGFEHELGARNRSQNARRGSEDGRIFLIPARRFGGILAASPATWNRTA